MADIAYDNAMRRREEIFKQINTLQDELDRLNREHARVEKFMADWEEFAGVPEHTENEKSLVSVDNIDKLKREPLGNPAKEKIGRFARDLIESQGEPISRNALSAALANAGIAIRGTNPMMVLSTMMWRMSKEGGEFVRLPRLGYWIRSKPYPPAEYDPSTPEPTLEEIGASIENLAINMEENGSLAG